MYSVIFLLLLTVQTSCYAADREEWEDDEELRSTPAWKLMLAISSRRAADALQLLADGAPIDTVIDGTTPLYAAADKLCPTVVHELLRKGAVVNQASSSKFSSKGETALGILMTRSRYVRNSRISFGCMRMIVRSLLDHGADPMLKGDGGLRPIDKIAKEIAISNAAALPIIITLLRASAGHNEYEQSKQVAAAYARQQAIKVCDICLDHYAMLNARAHFIETYPNDVADEKYNDALSSDCDKDHPEMMFF